MKKKFSGIILNKALILGKIELKSSEDVFKYYNENKNMSENHKVMCEAVMRFGITQRASDFINGYFERQHYKIAWKKDDTSPNIKNWGRKTFRKAQKFNQMYVQSNGKNMKHILEQQLAI